jgi:GWxTD domain-containing protein
MRRLFLCLCIVIVLCQLYCIENILRAQTPDSSKSIVFAPKEGAEAPKPKSSRLEGIVSIGVGPYSGFRNDGYYASMIQPTAGFEFLAEPGDGLHLLFGGHIGISDPVTSGFSFGWRAPLHLTSNPDLKIFSDLSILVFDDAALTGPLKYGARVTFGARTIGPVDLEYRLAGEWRGIGSDSIDGGKTRVLWWIGAEVGIAFSLVNDHKPLSRKDSLQASIHYIATHEEMDDLEAITSDAKLDDWLDRFWRVRNITPGSKANDARIEYEKRVEAANRMFSASNHLGILTDPGRVLAIYGFPDIEDKDHSLFNSRTEYMLWVYSGRLRDVTFAVFIFKSKDQKNTWDQVYSNVPGEITGNPPAGLPVRMSKWIQGF